MKTKSTRNTVNSYFNFMFYIMLESSWILQKRIKFIFKNLDKLFWSANYILKIQFFTPNIGQFSQSILIIWIEIKVALTTYFYKIYILSIYLY
jgi:hypothetical protein